MSGGVDSSVAAALMIERGYTCIGCTMKLLQGEEFAPADKTDSDRTDTAVKAASDTADAVGKENPHTCCSLDDVEDARSVARKLGMPYYVFNFSSEFGEKVIDRFVRIYQAGGTPKPCIDCNRYIFLFH